MAEDSEQDYQQRTKTLSIIADVDTGSMLRAIADRFNDSVSSLGGEILHDAVMEMFLALSDEDKKALSAKADALSRAEYEKRGIDANPYNGENGTWTVNAKHWFEAQPADSGESAE